MEYMSEEVIGLEGYFVDFGFVFLFDFERWFMCGWVEVYSVLICGFGLSEDNEK